MYHICSHLSVQSTRDLMCSGVWSKLGFVMDSDMKATDIRLPELHGDEDELDINWDIIYWICSACSECV